MLENKLIKNPFIPSEKQENNENQNIFEKSVVNDYNHFTFKRKKTTTCKSKREPLPMKLRALPESFWQQPNEPAQHAPGTVYPDLPIISTNQDTDDNLLTGSATFYIANNDELHKEVISTANTELLFSLFSVIETKEITPKGGKHRMSILRRGRSKKSSFQNKGVLRDEDPCLISTVTEALLPLLPERKKPTLKHNLIEQNHQALVTLSVNTELTAVTAAAGHSYSHLLSEVVIRL